ncbi:MAG: 16S rRNA (uracil(1498)-N(3))-methyltransferase [Lachnospiraceae bacterium]|nr:16S rRNA (uracil(1498)-N(3))-methyltransferase [Lachnospiraceae bacterium]
MYRFFVKKEQIDTAAGEAVITGPDRNHIKNVLRLRVGDELSVMVDSDREYRCAIKGFSDDEIELTILFIKESDAELDCETVLYQALPKGDKMETVITKAVELGASRIVPVATDRAVVRLEGDRENKKISRWNSISEAAAKQSKRAYVPEVSHVMTFEEALRDCCTFDKKIIPYELSDPDSMDETRKVIAGIKPGEKIAVFIGPEGGFTKEEIALAKEEGFVPVTLGHRILRTETAGQTVLSWIILQIEK